MMRSQLALGLLLWLGVFAAVAKAENVEVHAWFPDNPSMEFFPGKMATTVLGVRNLGIAELNITAAVANLALVSAPDGNIFNFTSLGFQVPALAPGEEANVEYGLMFPTNLPPREFYLNMKIVLGAGDVFVAKPLFNETINVIEESRLVDVELLGLYAMLLVALAAAVYGALELAKTRGWVKRSRKGKATTATQGKATAADNKSDWLRGTAADPRKKAAKQT